MPGIKFAPWRVPLERRLQTSAVLFYTLMFIIAPILSCLILLFLIFTPLAPLALAYASWIIYDYSYRKTSSKGGGKRRWQAVRNARVWRYFSNYFPAHLVKTSELDPEGNYLFGYHPHGIIGCGAFASFACEATGFSKVFPKITPHLLTLKPNFRWPLLRGLLLWCGVCDVSKESIEWILTKQGSGNAAIIVVGGAEEALEARPGAYCLTLKRRKGFIKMAIKTGASLVPVFSFGENDLFDQADNPVGSGLRKFQDKFKHFFGFSPPLFHGRGVFNYTFGLIPFRRPIYTVVGNPISVEQNSDPAPEVIDAVHQKYIDGLSQVFDDYKEKYGVDSSVKLKFV